MERNFKNLFGLLGQKAEGNVGNGAMSAFEESRGGMPKSYIPNFFYRPPFGYPRYKDLTYYRQLAASVYVDMVETAIIDEVCSVEYEIVAEDKSGNEILGKDNEVEIVKDFFDNPNTNPGESWNMIIRQMLPDLLEINSGVLVKTFNAFGQMVEIVARNGVAFTKNPDVYGMYTNRADLILMKDIYEENDLETTGVDIPGLGPIGASNGSMMLGGTMTPEDARENGAYFQYGFNTGARPVPFGKREIVWIEKKVRTDDLYGRCTMEALAKTVQTLVYAVEHNLDYFADNSIPPGVLGLDGISTEDLKAFGQQWTESQKTQDELGNWKKKFHKLATVNKMPKFERMGFTNAELELIQSQKWWSTLVWGAFGMTATEMGFTEDSAGAANQIVQTSAAKRKIIYPILKLLEYYINTEIIPEFGFEGIRYKYKIFDIDEETKKWTLFKLQTDSNLKTVNEIRNSEGLDELEGGDETNAMRSDRQQAENRMTDPKEQQANRMNNDTQATMNRMANKPKEQKAMSSETDLILQPGEEMDEKKLKKMIVSSLKENKDKIIQILETQNHKEQLLQIKSVDDVPGIIDRIFVAFGFKKLVDSIIKQKFDFGWEKSEKQISQNVPVNNKAVEFLQNYTFNNIKDMTDEIANDLKAELSRGIINGESIPKLKKRVENVFEVGENRAEMIARTETNRAENNGKLLAMKGSGLDMNKQWVTHEDDRTSAICRRLDGQIVALDEDFKDIPSGWEGQAPPSHVNCRSTVIFIDKEEVEKKRLWELEKEIADKKIREQELISKEIELSIQEKDADIKARKANLLKKLESDLDGGD